MRHQGRLTEWNDDRGFGFITPLEGGPRIFVHVRQFPRDKRRPMALDLVTYDVDKDARGRSYATHVLYMAPRGYARTATRSISTGGRQFPVALVVSALLVGALIVAGVFFRPSLVGKNRPGSSASPSTDQSIASLVRNRASGARVAGQGVVERILPDDNDGSRHQRFIVRLASGQTILVAHNIDLAPRLGSLAPGDTVAFSGVYEWNSMGGVIHWTHHDPEGHHAAGWLQHNGMIYQ
jgi:cold shock CspA family protein